MEYIVNQEKYQQKMESLISSQKTFESQINRGIMEACGISVLGQSERVKIQNELEADFRVRINETNIVNTKRDLLKSKDIIWIRDDFIEENKILSPEKAEEAIHNGFIVYVEKAKNHSRPFSDVEYALVGCLLVPSGAWKLSVPNFERTQFYPTVPVDQVEAV